MEGQRCFKRNLILPTQLASLLRHTNTVILTCNTDLYSDSELLVDSYAVPLFLQHNQVTLLHYAMLFQILSLAT